jgi:hypothetical protein
MKVHAVDPDEKWLYRVGGVSTLVIAIAYIIIVVLYALVGTPPTGGEAWLKYLAGKTTLWWAIVGISVLTNFLYVPVVFSLYFALRGINRNTMMIGVAFVSLFVVLELAVNWSCYTALIMLSGDYAAATSDIQRAAYVAAANYPSAIIASPLALVYAIGTLSFGFLIIGLVMLRGVFNKVTAYLGIITGILGLAAVAGLSIAVILNAVFATVWLLFVGYRLYRLAAVS